MDALVTLLLVAGAATIFVAMVRRTNSKGRELGALSSSKPELLKPQQRKSLKRLERKQGVAPDSPKLVTPKPASSRAMRSGWSMGVIAFTYQDAAGDISFRKVTVHSANSTYIKGECHSRNAARTFRVDKILGDVTNCLTGEIFPVKEIIHQLQR